MKLTVSANSFENENNKRLWSFSIFQSTYFFISSLFNLYEYCKVTGTYR